MAPTDALRARLVEQLDATVARRSYRDILRDVPPEARGICPEGLPEAYSLWQILEHMRICQADYFQYCTDPEYSPGTWPDDYWPANVAPPSEAAWEESLRQFEADIQGVKELLENPSIDITSKIAHANGTAYHGTTYAEEIGAIVDHNAYHLGQFVTVRRLLGAWPPKGMGAPSWEGEL